jgi:hypothetical protein
VQLFHTDIDQIVPSAQEWLRRSYAELVTSGAQLLLLLLALQLRTRSAWLACLGLMALVSTFAWLSALYRLRALRNTPTSTIAAAAQGQVELAGRGQPFGEPPLLSPLRARTCLWYRFRVDEQRDDEWHTLDRGESSTSFVLQDRTGECVVQPESAEIFTRHRERWIEQGRRYTEWLLIREDRVRVVGHFRTLGAGTEAFDTKTELGALLAEWKRDMPRLLARYDRDRDGVLGVGEWEGVRRDAMAEVLRLRHAVQRQPETHIVNRPADGQLFLISNLPQQDLQRRYLLWSWAHLAMLVGALWGLAWSLAQPPF